MGYGSRSVQQKPIAVAGVGLAVREAGVWHQAVTGALLLLKVVLMRVCTAAVAAQQVLSTAAQTQQYR